MQMMSIKLDKVGDSVVKLAYLMLSSYDTASQLRVPKLRSPLMW